ncbi:hypothetical protein [Streptomyces sp. NPDC048442]|uniref:hypothetical protein n=1 Tax=Streptomyces sp. NPDC048442 TaxID=3154823 RepID=UPI0034424BD3
MTGSHPALTAHFPRWTVKGTAHHRTTCACCGHENLEHTVALAPLDLLGDASGPAVHFGPRCAAAVLHRPVAAVALAACHADMRAERKDAWARKIISLYGPMEFGTDQEMEAAWNRSGNASSSSWQAREFVTKFLADARAQLTDTTLRPTRPHSITDFQPFLVVLDTSNLRHHWCGVVPRENTEGFHTSARRDWTGMVSVTVAALDETSAVHVAFGRRGIAQYNAERGWF